MRIIKKHILLLQKGDTIIEVMFASAIAALLIVLALSIMNRGLAETQMTVESTFVRQGIDSQAEALRYARDQWLFNKNVRDDVNSTWNKVLASNTTGAITQLGSCSIPAQGFYIKDIPNNGSENPIANPAPAFTTGSGVADVFAYPGKGMWVEARNNATQKYVDLHIRACWNPPFQGPQATLGTIVRLHYRDDAAFNSGSSTLVKPTLTLSATPTTVNAGSSSTVSWSSSDAVSCSSANFPTGSGLPAISGSFNTGPITATKTYQLTCTGANGAYITKSITITMIPTYTLTVSNPGSLGRVTGTSINCGQGNTTCTRSNIPTGTVISLSASAASGYVFSSWSPADCGSFSITSNKSCSANFNYLPPRDPLYRCYQYNTYSGNSLIYTNHLYMANGQGGVGYGCYPGVETNDPKVHYEGIQGYAPREGNSGRIPIYGGFNLSQYDSFYTSSYDEYVSAHNSAGYNMASGFQFWAYSYPCTVAGTAPLYRWYSAAVGNHYYSTSATPGSNEPNGFAAVDGGGTFVYEGVIGCIFTGTSP